MKKINLHIAPLYYRLLKISCFSLLLLFLPGSFSYGQNKTATEYQVKAIFLYNFTQFIEWPQAAFSSPNEPFVIGLIGEDPFGSYLDDAVAGERIGTHPIVVKRYKTIKEIGKCNMLYMNSDDQPWMERVLLAVSEKNTLTVSDAPNFNRWGGMVRFFTEDGKIRFQINVDQSRAAQLNISSKLLSVAKTD